ncbi:MAG: BppU family phage baseplate upper protein [Intestinibacter sp.]|uniref:BppU family phage baseplate upper protein n=1 Tax=Intestinibacter sp. TaxID=1965304 RepID=UPI003F1560DE
MRDYVIDNDLKQSRFENIKFVQYDNGSTITINVFEDGQAINLENYTVIAKFKRADGEEYNRSTSVLENKITTTLDSTVTSVPGNLKISFKIIYDNSSKQVSTFMLIADIEENFGEGNLGDIGGNTGSDIVVDVDLSNYYNKQEVDNLIKDIGSPIQEQIDSAVTTYLNVNPVTGGLTSVAKSLLITILRKAAYDIDEQNKDEIKNMITELETALSSSTDTKSYNITNTLTNVINSNSSTIIEEKASYNATLTANSGYSLSDVTITMGGVDITSSCYSDGIISISEVTGDIVITANATQVATIYTIEYVLGNCVSSNTNENVTENDAYSTIIIPSEGYVLNTATITMGGVDITSSCYSDGTISIAQVTGNVIITVNAIIEEKAPELNTNGLVALFDKDCEYITNGAYPQYQYQILPKQGDYILGSWSKQINSTDTHGIHGLIGNLSLDKQVPTTIASPTTWAVCTYTSTSAQNGYAPNNLCNNFGSNFYYIACNPYYINTNGESVQSGDISSSMGGRSVGYHRLIMVIDGNTLKIYKNAKLLKTLNGSDFTDFASWKTPTGIGAGFGDTMYTYFEAIYDRALSEVEVVELDAYIQTLEVA